MKGRDFALIVFRRKLLATFVAAVVMGCGLLFLSRQQKVYGSTTSVALLPENTGTNASVTIYGEMVKNLLPTYAELVSSRTFLDGVAAALPFRATGGTLLHHVHAEAVSGAGIMRIVAHWPDPVDAAAIAKATTSQLLTQLEGNGVVTLKVFDEARVPDAPVAPNPKLIIAASIIVALGFAIAAALIWDRIFGRVNDPRELSDATGVPVLGVLGEERSMRGGARLVVGRADLVRTEDNFRALQTNLMFVMDEATTRTVAITSLNPEEGKSTITANLAVMVAELGFRVLLVDADVHRPTQHELFGLDNTVGLSSTVLSDAPLQAVAQNTAFAGLRVVTSGPPLSDRRQEVSLYQFLPRFAEMADILLVDTPPLRASADVRLLVASVGSVVIAVRAGSSSASELGDALEGLQVLDTKVLGTVLTRSSNRVAPGGSVAYYGYRRDPVKHPLP